MVNLAHIILFGLVHFIKQNNILENILFINKL